MISPILLYVFFYYSNWRFEKTLNFTFSCPVLASDIRKRTTRQGVKITIRKFRFLCVGEGVIQKKTLTKSDMKPIANIRGFMPTLLNMCINTFTSEEFQKSNVAEKHRDFFELRQILMTMCTSIGKPFPVSMNYNLKSMYYR